MRRSNQNIFSRIFRSIFRRQFYGLIRPFRRFRNRIRYIIYRLLPSPLRRFVPRLEKESFALLRKKVKQKWQAKKKAEEEKLLFEQPEIEVSEELRQARLERIPQVSSGYVDYHCVNQDPLRCNFPLETTQQDPQAKHCLKCRFPAIIPLKAEIIGRKGRYQIVKYLGSRGRGRLYTGINVNTEEPVTIKEYLLPKLHFNEKETRQARNVFENQGSINLSDGRRQDFRLPMDTEAIGDRHDSERCYLVSHSTTNNLPTLRLYLAQYGPMPAILVRETLNQILQTLESLHYQKFRFPTGRIHTNLAHNNLNLDSILISADRRPIFVQIPITIYLSDLALWEDLFIPPPHTPDVVDLQEDLVSLGYIAFYLLAGASIDVKNQPLNPRRESHWQTTDLALKNYIYRLLKLKQPFPDVFVARQALLSLPPQLSAPQANLNQFPILDHKKKVPWWVWLIVTLLTILLLSELIGWLVSRRQVTATKTPQPLICCIAQVAATPRGIFNYTSQQKGSWDYALTQENLIIKNKTLENELKAKLPRFFKVKYTPTLLGKEIIPQIANQEVDFAITSINSFDENNLDNDKDLGVETFAYDGIVVFVAFSYNTGDRRLLASLNGQITLEQLRQLYTGQVDNWRQFGGPDLPVKLYIPENQEIIQIFAEKILQNPVDIDLFRSLLPEKPSSFSILNKSEQTQFKINPLPIYQMLRTILREFEDRQIGGIGFAAVSKVFGQCAVYPLAIAREQDNGIQPFIQQNNQPIDITLDLCKAKGSYEPNTDVFQSREYPLAFPLMVVYPRNNNLPPAGRKFAEILNTKEVQQMIAKTGLVPAQKLE